MEARDLEVVQVAARDPEVAQAEARDLGAATPGQVAATLGLAAATMLAKRKPGARMRKTPRGAADGWYGRASAMTA